jgi:hypothetical protein
LAGKLMLTIFWDSQGPILETYLEGGTNVTIAAYCDMLRRWLEPTVCCKRRGRLLRSSCCCTTASVPILRPTHWKHSGSWNGKSWNIQLTVQIWCHLIFTVLDCLKKLLGGRRFQCDDVKNAMHQWLRAWPKTLSWCR